MLGPELNRRPSDICSKLVWNLNGTVVELSMPAGWSDLASSLEIHKRDKNNKSTLSCWKFKAVETGQKAKLGSEM